jgi:glycosyltransferase involved in cell wall biosynthesis
MQTVTPSRWIVIDDGSKDGTARILDDAARQTAWIEVHHLPADRPRQAGGEAVIMRFLDRQRWRDADYIFRLDADLSFGPDMIESLIREFERDPRLGIASPTLAEPMPDGTWKNIVLRSMHTRGASKFYSRACFEAIGHLDASLGWDIVDEARALRAGFSTRSFPHILARHHRPQGIAGGLLRGRLASGRAAYYAGYSPLYLTAAALRRMLQPPLIVGGVLLLAGYFEGYLRRLPRVDDLDLIRFIRRQQIRRLLAMESLWH